MNAFLLRPYTKEEIFKAITQTGATKAPEPNGFPVFSIKKILVECQGENISCLLAGSER